MKLSFVKAHGTGNDFILADNRRQEITLTQEQAAMLCHRRFGIGADGLMLLETEPGADFRMVYYNSDGRISSMCGNGGRCITAYARELGLIDRRAEFMAADGRHEATIGDDGEVSLRMNDVRNIEKGDGFFFVDTGSPHYVRIVEDVNGVDVLREGRAIRNSDRFREEGTNVNFIALSDNDLQVRTYERGVEDETYSCGTGVTAGAIIAAYNKMIPGNYCRVKTLGGNLEVKFEKVLDQNFYNIWLKGPAVKVFEGTIDI
jgi:diaminopimelate epimerase